MGCGNRQPHFANGRATENFMDSADGRWKKHGLWSWLDVKAGPGRQTFRASLGQQAGIQRIDRSIGRGPVDDRRFE